MERPSPGRVVGVHDGDTITVLDANKTQFKVRLLGIDAPESRQAFGTRSKQHLSHLVYDQQVRVEYNKRDRNRRILGKVFGIAPCLVVPQLLPTLHTRKMSNGP